MMTTDDRRKRTPQPVRERESERPALGLWPQGVGAGRRFNLRPTAQRASRPVFAHVSGGHRRSEIAVGTGVGTTRAFLASLARVRTRGLCRLVAVRTVPDQCPNVRERAHGGKRSEPSLRRSSGVAKPLPATVPDRPPRRREVWGTRGPAVKLLPELLPIRSDRSRSQSDRSEPGTA